MANKLLFSTHKQGISQAGALSLQLISVTIFKEPDELMGGLPDIHRFFNSLKPMAKEDYYLIPGVILRDGRLSAEARILYCVVARQAGNKKGFCWATNAALSSVCGFSIRSIIRYLKEMENIGYVVIKTDGNNREIHLPNPTSFGTLSLPNEVRNPTDFGTLSLPNEVNHSLSVLVLEGVKERVIQQQATAEKPAAIIELFPNPLQTQPPAGASPNSPTPIAQPPAAFDFSAENTPWWNDQISLFLKSQMVLEIICRRGITIPRGKELMRRFAEKRQFEGDVKSFGELRSHFGNWFKNGFIEGYINPDGTQKNEAKNEQSTKSAADEWRDAPKSVAEEAADTFFRDLDRTWHGKDTAAGG